MQKTYRVFTLQALRTSPLEIAERISELKNTVEREENSIQESSDKLIFVWAMAISIFITLLIGLLTSSIIVGGITLVVFVILSLVLTRFPALKNKVVASGRYKKQFQAIEESRQEIEKLNRNAISYRDRLEITSGPGLLSCYADILLSPYFYSMFPENDREFYVGLSREGKGHQIDIHTYCKLISELKNADLSEYIDTDELVEKVSPQNKSSAAIAYARLIATGSDKSDEDQVCFSALTGLNAWHSFELQGRPANWEHHEHRLWEVSKAILESAYNKNIIGLAKSISEFQAVEKRR